MKLFQKLLKSPDFTPLLFVFAIGVLASWSLIFQRGYFNMHDDLQMMRQLQLEKCFLDGQIPCRWVPDMGYGYGFPLFNFYPPLPYFVGEIFRLFTIPFHETVKLTFAVAFIASGVSMYYLVKQFFGKWGGVVSAAFYIWAPYHSVDIYVRGAMNEAWALVFFPLILLTAYKLLKETKTPVKWIVWLAISWVGLMLSHNLMVLIFTPVFISWCAVFWLQKREFKKVWHFASAGGLAFSLAAFFTLPAVVEQKLVHVDMLTRGYYEYIAHYATIGQLLTKRYWGFGPSIWGPEDTMPFQIGHAHWILSVVVLGALIFKLLRSRKRSTKNKPDLDFITVIVFSFAFGWFAAFMVHQYSTPIWQQIKPLSFVQFPWRFLTLVILGFSITAGAIVRVLPQKYVGIISSVLIITVMAINWNYFKPLGEKMGPLTDYQKFNGVAWEMQRTAGIYDYLPNTSKFNPKFPQGTLAEFYKGKGEILNAHQGTNWAKFDAEAKVPGSTLIINLFEFPNWKITLNGKSVESYIPETEIYGRMYLDVPEGKHKIELKLTDTPIRTFSNTLSLIAWGLMLAYPLWKKRFLTA